MNAEHLRYSSVAIFLHWAIAALVLVNVWLGLQYGELKGLAQFKILQWHKSVGVTILLLMAGRLAWRLAHRPPSLSVMIMPRWQRIAAACSHWGFYVLLLALPLTGWVIVSASPTNIRTLLYGVVPWPHLSFVHGLSMAVRKEIEAAFTIVHHQLVNILYVLVAVHITAAMKHQFWDRDGAMTRMLPRWRFSDAATPTASEAQHETR